MYTCKIESEDVHSKGNAVHVYLYICVLMTILMQWDQ